MNTFSKVSLNTFYQLIAKFINALAGFFILGLITRNLGESAVGIYTLVLTYISLYFIAVDYGANAYAVKAMRNHVTYVFNKLLTQRLIVGTVVTLIAILIASFLPQQAYTSQVKQGIFLVCSVILVQAILASANAVFQERENYAFQMLTNLASASAQVLFALFLLQTTQSLTTFFIAFLVASFIGATTSLILVRRYTKSLQLLWDPTFNKALAKETAPLTISMLTNLLYFRLDALIMPFYRSLAEVGHYNVAYRIFENALAIPTFLGNALYPTLLSLHQTDRFNTQLKKIFTISLSIAILTTVILIIIAPYLVLLINGTYQQQIIDYLRILALGLPFFFATSLLMWVIITKGRQKSLIWIYSLNMVLTLVLNLTLVPRYGAYASAYTTIALEAFVLLLGVVVLHKN